MTIEVLDTLGRLVVLDILEAASRTAIRRIKPSVPARKLMKLLVPGESVFDMGCGRGADIEYFRRKNIVAEGYDPTYRPEPSFEEYRRGEYDWVLCSFVLNVIPQNERQRLVKDLFEFLPEYGAAFFATRSAKDIEQHRKPTWIPYQDGYVTTKGTFQKGFEPDELCCMLEDIGFDTVNLHGRHPVMAAAYK